MLSYDDFEALASSAEAGAGGVLFHPYLNGERCPYWDPSLRGSFSGLSVGHGSNHLARAVIEGVALSLFDAYSVFESCGVESGPTSVVGGGCRNTLLLTVLSTLFGRPMTIREQVDSSYGAALLAIEALTGGITPAEAIDVKEMHGTTVEPVEELAETYARLAVEFTTRVPKARET